MKCQECAAPITVDGVGCFCSVDCYSKAFERSKEEKTEGIVKVGSLVKYIDSKGWLYTALVLGVKPNGVLRLKIFRTAQPNLELEAGPEKWER